MSTIRITIQTDNEAAFGCEGNELKRAKRLHVFCGNWPISLHVQRQPTPETPTATT